MPDLTTAVVYYVVFLFSTTVHEAAHALAAKFGGDLTAYHGGQVSLDPRPHIRREPVGMVLLPVISVVLSGWPFGFASAPYDPSWAMRHPRRAAWMALAGPGANLVLVVVAVLVVRIGVTAGAFYPPEQVRFGEVVGAAGPWGAVALFVGVLFSLNLVLAALNLLPFPPLDGSGAIPLLLNAEMTTRYQRFLWGNPALGWIGILVAWQVFAAVFQPVFLVAVNVLYPGVSYR